MIFSSVHITQNQPKYYHVTRSWKSQYNTYLSPSEVLNIPKKVDPSEATGPDGIDA